MARSFSPNLLLKNTISETLPDSFTSPPPQIAPHVKREKKNQQELMLEILTWFEKHYYLHKDNYDNESLKTRDVMEMISTDISIYKTRNLLLRLEEQGYISGMVSRGTQSLRWQLTYEHRQKLVIKDSS